MGLVQFCSSMGRLDNNKPKNNNFEIDENEKTIQTDDDSNNWTMLNYDNGYSQARGQINSLNKSIRQQKSKIGNKEKGGGRRLYNLRNKHSNNPQNDGQTVRISNRTGKAVRKYQKRKGNRHLTSLKYDDVTGHKQHKASRQ